MSHMLMHSYVSTKNIVILQYCSITISQYITIKKNGMLISQSRYVGIFVVLVLKSEKSSTSRKEQRYQENGNSCSFLFLA